MIRKKNQDNMKANTKGKIVVLIGLVLLLHCALSVIQFRQWVKATGRESVSTPIDIVVECLVTMLVNLWGAILLAGEFKQKYSAPEHAKKSFDSLISNESFRMFHHRGKTISLD